jgi:C4-dicarboxylate-specific signal transduction histidine kinase
MHIPEDFEDKLSKEPIFKTVKEQAATPDLSGFGAVTAAPTHITSAHPSAGSHDSDTSALRARVQALIQENTQLKTQVRILQDKLIQIKKIA